MLLFRNMSHSQEFLSCRYTVPVPWNKNSTYRIVSLTIQCVGTQENGEFIAAVAHSAAAF